MKKSMYSNLTDDEVDKLQAESSQKYGKDLLDSSRQPEERKLKKLVAAKYKKKARQDQEILSVIECFWEYLYRKLKELSLIIYLAMSERNDFGQHGEERVSVSLCRCIMNIPNDHGVSEQDIEKFLEVVFECDRRNGFLGKEYINYCNNFSIDIFGQRFTSVDFDIVGNEIFRLMDIDYFIWATLSNPYGIRFAFGILEERFIEGNRILLMKQEFIRSPQLFLGIAAEVYQNTTIIRQNAIDVIAHNKWLTYFDQSVFEYYYALQHPYSSIREGLKRFALFYADVANTKEAMEKKAEFEEAMLDGIVFHELGHHVSHNDMKPEHYEYHWVFPNASSIGQGMQEELADLAPQNGSKKGAFARFLEIAQTNTKRATRNIYMYLSDNLFIEDDEEYFGILTDISVSTALSFIDNNGTVNFDRITTEIKNIYKFFQQRFGQLVDRLLIVIKNAEYDCGLKKLDFPALEEKIYQTYKGTRNEKPLEELRHTNTYWENVVGYLKQFSADGWEEYRKVMEEEAESVKRALLELITNGDGGKYNYSLREYIVERCKEIGIIKEPPNVIVPNLKKNGHFLHSIQKLILCLRAVVDRKK
jgi:hypothetical protein